MGVASGLAGRAVGTFPRLMSEKDMPRHVFQPAGFSPREENWEGYKMQKPRGPDSSDQRVKTTQYKDGEKDNEVHEFQCPALELGISLL